MHIKRPVDEGERQRTLQQLDEFIADDGASPPLKQRTGVAITGSKMLKIVARRKQRHRDVVLFSSQSHECGHQVHCAIDISGLALAFIETRKILLGKLDSGLNRGKQPRIGGFGEFVRHATHT